MRWYVIKRLLLKWLKKDCNGSYFLSFGIKSAFSINKYHLGTGKNVRLGSIFVYDCKHAGR
jgi:hypothetical protein